MKKLLIAAGISIVPIFFLGLAIPAADIILFHPDQVNKGVFWLYVFLLGASLAITVSALARMVYYTKTIDRLEQKEKETDMLNNRLNELIRHYNSLISQAKNQSLQNKQ